MNFRTVIRIGGLCGLLAVTTLLSSSPGSASAELGHYDTTSSATVTSVAPGVPRNETITLTVPAGEFLDAGMDPFGTGPGPIIFEPVGVTITPGCNKAGFRDFNNDNVTNAGETPCLVQGAAAGTHTWQATLGLSNSPCSTPATITVDLFNVAMPDNELDPRASTNIVFPRAQGVTDRFAGWQVGSVPVGGTAPMDVNADGRAEAGSFAIQNYPSYLLDLADPDGVGPTVPVLPRAVYGGLSKVNGEWIPFYFAQFASGQLNTAFAGTSHPFSRMVSSPAASSTGHPLLPVSGDPTAILTSPTSITDVCAPSTTTTDLAATVGGVTRAANPPTAGTHITMVSRVSARDLENDGYETAIDTCPAVANVENPRSTAGPDGDMLDSACDPTPAVAAHDADNDGIQNAGDNCPLATNASQVEGELTFPPDYFTHAFDGGPTADRLGDACESGSVVFTQNNKSTTINLSPTVANGHWHLRGEVHPRCYSTAPVDADGDGYCSTGTAGCAGSCLTDSTATDSGACAGTVPPSCVQRHSAWGSGVLAPQGLFDTDRGGGDSTGSTPPDPGGIGEGITCPGGASDVCPQGAFDSDWIETYVGTNPAQSCAADATLNNEPYDSWIYDLNDDQRANLSDLSMYTGPYSRFVNQPGSSVRYDFNVDGVTNLADVSILGGAPFNKQCRRTDGTFGEPQ